MLKPHPLPTTHVALDLVSPPPVLSGLAQCAELCWQLRGQAGRRQVPGAKVALQHNIGLGGAVVVTLYRKGFPEEARYPASSLHFSQIVHMELIYKQVTKTDVCKHICSFRP